MDEVRWTYRMEATRARALFATFPNLRRLPGARRTAFLDGIAATVRRAGGEVDDRFITVLYTAQRRPDSVPSASDQHRPAP